MIDKIHVDERRRARSREYHEYPAPFRKENIIISRRDDHETTTTPNTLQVETMESREPFSSLAHAPSAWLAYS